MHFTLKRRNTDFLYQLKNSSFQQGQSDQMTWLTLKIWLPRATIIVELCYQLIYDTNMMITCVICCHAKCQPTVPDNLVRQYCGLREQ